MLPKEFLEVRKYKGKIFPKFLTLNDLEITEKVLNIYRKSLGDKLKVARKELRQMETSKNYRRLRGLARIIENNIHYKSSTPLIPYEVRKFLFSKGFVTTKDERQRTIQEASEKFDSTIEEIENSIYADLEEESLIEEIRIRTPEELLRKYNLSLLQTSLFNSLRMSFWSESEHKRIFWAIKRLGLMYEVGEGEITLTGPASILKQTRKYGTSFAKIVPFIVSSPEWWIKAEVVDEYSGKIYRMDVSSSRTSSSSSEYIPFPEKSEVIEFDSSLEEELYTRLKASRPDIEIQREPRVIKAGDYAFIPDFRLRKGDKEVYIEIAGFWTEDYLKKKAEKIKKADVPLIVIGKEELTEVAPFVVSFERKLPYIKILKLVNSYFEEKEYDSDLEMALKEVQKTKALNVINLAKKYGVEVTEIQKKIRESFGSKISVENWLFDRKYVEDIKKKLDENSDMETLLEKDGIDVLLDFLGYKIIWEGITAARIVKKRENMK